jgi:hypothetical protein
MTHAHNQPGIRESLDRERGSALLMALFTLLLASLIGLALAFSGMYEVKVARNYNTSTEAFYIAEAGLNHAIHVIESNSLDFGAVLNGEDGVAGTDDDGVLILSAIPEADRIPAAGINCGAGSYTVHVTDGSGGAQTTLVVTATGRGTNGSVSVLEGQLNNGGGMSAPAAGYGGSPLLDGNLYVGGGAATSFTMQGNSGISCNVIAFTNVSLQGTPNIIGDVYSVGSPTDTNISLGGSAAITGNAYATGTIADQNNVSGDCHPEYTIPPSPPPILQFNPGTDLIVNPSDYRFIFENAPYDTTYGQYYTLKSDGTVICESCSPGTGGSTGGTWNDWSFSDGKWTLGNKGTLEGTFYVEGDAQIDNKHGTPSSRFHMTVIAEGYIDIATNNDLAPSWANCALVAGTDIALAGNASVNGWIGAHEQVDLIGGTGISSGAPIIVENAASLSSKVTSLSFGGNTAMDCSGGVGSSNGFYMPASSGGGATAIQRVSWREVRN